MALIVGLGILANTFWGTIQHGVLSYAIDTTVSGLLQETNNQRTANGLAGLTLNSQLNAAAQAKADDMVARDYWSHNTPEGDAPWVFIVSAGYKYQTAGENLAYGFLNSTATVKGWMDSPGHRANILNGTYKEVGFGIANSPNYQGTGPETVVVAMYGCQSACTVTAVVPTAKTPEPPKPKSVPAPEAKDETEETPAPPTEEQLAVTPIVSVDEEKSNPTPEPVVATRKVARLQLLSGATATWTPFAVSAIATVAVAVFVLRHGLLLRRVWVKSEAFIHKHPLFDIALIAIATIGFVLIQTDGIIR